MLWPSQIPVVVVLNKLLVVPPHVCQGLHRQLAVVYELIYYSDSQYSSLIKMIHTSVALITFLHELSCESCLKHIIHAVTTYNSYHSGTHKFSLMVMQYSYHSVTHKFVIHQS